MLSSGLFQTSYLIRDSNCVRFCLNPVCREVNEGCITVHNLQLASAWIRN